MTVLFYDCFSKPVVTFIAVHPCSWGTFGRGLLQVIHSDYRKSKKGNRNSVQSANISLKWLENILYSLWFFRRNFKILNGTEVSFSSKEWICVLAGQGDISELTVLMACKKGRDESSNKINCFMWPELESLYHNMKTTVALFRKLKTSRFLECPQYSSACKMPQTTVYLHLIWCHFI